MKALFPGLTLAEREDQSRPMPSRKTFCEGCPYASVFHALTEVIERSGGRERVVVVGDPGCMVRGQLTPLDLLDVKASLGSSVAIGAGIALALPFRRAAHGGSAGGRPVALHFLHA